MADPPITVVGVGPAGPAPGPAQGASDPARAGPGAPPGPPVTAPADLGGAADPGRTVAATAGAGPDLDGLIARAALVVGARRHLALLRDVEAPARAFDGDLEGALAAIAAADGPVVVLASGDPGYFGIVRLLAERFGPDRLCVHPAVSPVAAAFAAVGLPWDDAVVVSAHGRDPRVAVHACLALPKVAVLTAPGAGPAELARRLLEAGCGRRRLVVAERLGTPSARIREHTLETAAGGDHAVPNTVLVLDPARPLVAGRPAAVAPPPVRPPPPGRDRGSARVRAGWGLDSEHFAHRDGLITGPALRALALAHLAPRVGDLVWDVGAGSGSVGIECARFGAAVVAVDSDVDALDLVRANAADHGVAVRRVCGTAPGALEDLPDPDLAFVGGGGRDLPAILEVATARTRRRLALTLVTLERVTPALNALEGAGWAARARMVQTAAVAPLAGAHRLAPDTPVFLLTAERP